MPTLSRRAESLGTENAFVVLAEVNELLRARARTSSRSASASRISPRPSHVQEAAVDAIRGGKHGYTPSAGIDELREAAAAYDGARAAASRSAPDDVVVGAGAKPFIAYAIASITDHRRRRRSDLSRCRGSRSTRSQILANGAVPVPIYLREARQFAFDPAELDARITPKTKLLILNSPQNPTGGCFRAPTWRRSPRSWASIRRSGSSPTRSTRAWCTTASSSRSRSCPACTSARSSPTARRRPGR